MDLTMYACLLCCTVDTIPDEGVQNMLFPQLGKAGMPYAKSVPNLRTINGSQPDPGDLFDRRWLFEVLRHYHAPS